MELAQSSIPQACLQKPVSASLIPEVRQPISVLSSKAKPQALPPAPASLCPTSAAAPSAIEASARPLMRQAPPPHFAVAVTQRGFCPPTLKVPAGAVVEWTVSDQGSLRGYVVAFDAQEHCAESPYLQAGSTFKCRFLEEGSFPYRCSINYGLKGQITVTPPEPPKVFRSSAVSSIYKRLKKAAPAPNAVPQGAAASTVDI